MDVVNMLAQYGVVGVFAWVMYNDRKALQDSLKEAGLKIEKLNAALIQSLVDRNADSKEDGAITQKLQQDTIGAMDRLTNKIEIQRDR